MTHEIRGFGFVCCLVLVSTFTAYSQANSDAQVSAASAPSSTAAYVYVQVQEGEGTVFSLRGIQGMKGPVYGFRASSNGRLSPVSGSPFKPAGQMIGGTPTKLFTLGEELIHSYRVASDGIIGSQLSQISYFDYSGDECTDSKSEPYGFSSPWGTVLDHTGKYIYMDLWCGGMAARSAEFLTFLIHSDGSFSYDGDALDSTCGDVDCFSDLPSILGNESFAYADEDNSGIFELIGFRRTSAGTLESMQFAETDPPTSDRYAVAYPDASPTANYLVVQLFPEGGFPEQLGSYTVDSSGNISTTNTWSNMPTSSLGDPVTTFSPSGDLFVAYGAHGTGPAIEIYKFNGAAPLTLWRTLLNGGWIQEAAWDKSNHLYAISYWDNKLYVFTVTPTSVTEETSIAIGRPFKMVVVSK